MNKRAVRGRAVVTFLVAAFVGLGPPRAEAQRVEAPPAEHVILISVDGLRPEFYLDDRWPAAMMQSMANAGVYARRVRGVTPTVTYPSHTTIVTGALPARHGIFHNRPFEPTGATGRWYVDHDSVRVPAIWDAVRAAGGTSAGISWPVTFGAGIDWNIPEYWAQEAGEGSGPGANEGALRAATTPPGLIEEIESAAIGAFPRFYWGQNLSREDVVGAMAGYLIETHRPTLLVVHLNQTDYFQHEYGRDDPTVRRRSPPSTARSPGWSTPRGVPVLSNAPRSSSPVTTGS